MRATWIDRLVSARGLRIATLLLGAALLAGLVLSSDVRSILSNLARVGPGIVVIVAIEFVGHAFNTLGWWFTFPAAQRSGDYWRLFWVRSAGSALNEATPVASLGGEPAKVALLRTRMSTGAATASLLATKVSFCTAKAAFVIVGMAMVWSRLRLPPEGSWALFSAFSGMVIGIAVFAAVQIWGIGSGTITALRRVRMPARFILRIESALHEVDAHLRDFYRARTGDLVRSVAAHLCAYGCGTIQILLLLGWLGLEYDVVAAIGIEAFGALVGLVFFAVPASLGVQEGGKVLIFAALGLPRPAAMAVGITYRLVSLLDIAIGLAALVLLQHRMPQSVRKTKNALVSGRVREESS